jgi:hypothetical protein
MSTTEPNIDLLIERESLHREFRNFIDRDRDIKRDRKIRKEMETVLARARELDCTTEESIKTLIGTARAIGEIAKAYAVTTDDLSFVWYRCCKPLLVSTVGFASDGPLRTMKDYDSLYTYCYELLHDPERFNNATLDMPEKSVAFEIYSLADLRECSCLKCKTNKAS